MSAMGQRTIGEKHVRTILRALHADLARTQHLISLSANAPAASYHSEASQELRDSLSERQRQAQEAIAEIERGLRVPTEHEQYRAWGQYLPDAYEDPPGLAMWATGADAEQAEAVFTAAIDAAFDAAPANVDIGAAAHLTPLPVPQESVT